MWMIYGATGYTGELASREAARRGFEPVLAGRSPAVVAALASELGLPSRAFDLDDPRALREGLAGVAAVLHCAGPFVRTSAPLVTACLAAGVHYLDITGEIAVFETTLARSEEARQAGIALLPGVGFDVVPTDCLAARLAAALPNATELALAFASDRGGYSRGTLKTMIEALPNLGAIRRGGRIIPVPAGYAMRRIDFGGALGERWAMTIPWGDVATAYHSTGIPDIRVYTAAPPKAIRRLRRLSLLAPLAIGPVKRWLQRRVDRREPGPSAEVRATARTYLWGEAKDAAGHIVTARIETPEAYAFTAVSAVEAANRTAAGAVQPGAWTPSKAFGADFVDGLPGVKSEPVVRVA